MPRQYTNNLIRETSPYLLQHAHNPVNWYPWGKEALEKARKENKVILVSIGYSACHWCHVMEKESFEDEETAVLMNEHFINIKIDREERPDLDHIYMDAVQAMTGSGGWPLNVFLTPDTKPFYGGTYFPPQRAFNRTSWTEVLTAIAAAWKERREEIEAQAENLTAYIAKAGNFSLPVNTIETGFENENAFDKCRQVFVTIMQSADTVWGGFGRAPKFPQVFCIQYLLQYYHYTKDEQALQHALLSIDKMLQGGIYDHVGGGLARYSTDIEWLAPHFEKMLYDNALLIMVLCDAFQITKQDKYAVAVSKTIDFITGEMMHPQGGFYSALDADSEGEEGKFYVWDKAEIERILEKDAAIFCDFFDVTENGNWERKNILRILQPVEVFVQGRQITTAEFTGLINDCLLKLRAERNKRVHSGLDDKIILGWNALMLKAVAQAAAVLRKESWKTLAVNNYNFLIEQLGMSLPLAHTWKDGKAKYPAFLDDHAYLADACLALYELTFDTGYLDKAKELSEYAIEHFSDNGNLFFHYTHQAQDDVIVRKKEIYDGATPSANAVMAFNLYRLSVIYDNSTWRKRSDDMMMSIAGAVEKYPASFAAWAGLLLQKIKGLDEIAVVGQDAMPWAGLIVSTHYTPARVIMAAMQATSAYPLLNGKEVTTGTRIYMCKNYMCEKPFYDIELFFEAMGKR